MKSHLFQGRMIGRGYVVTTAEITYRLPDYPDILQTFIWQNLDVLPELPELRKFLNFWEKNIEGQLHSVIVGHKDLLVQKEWGYADHEFALQ